MNARKALAAATLALSAFVALPAHAQEPALTSRVVVGLGSWIAAQGNAALYEIEQDLKQDLLRAVKPILPEQDSAQQPQRAPSAQ